MRIAIMTALILSVGGSGAFGQTSAPGSSPAAAPAPGAAATGAPALAPSSSSTLPGGGSLLPSQPRINSTPSQSNVDLHPATRLTAPGGAAGPPAAGQMTPGQAPPGSSAQPQPGGANSSAPAKAPKKTGNDYNVTECMGFWDAGTHMTKGEWKAACIRVQNRLNNLEDVAEAVGTKKTTKRASARRNVN